MMPDKDSHDDQSSATDRAGGAPAPALDLDVLLAALAERRRHSAATHRRERLAAEFAALEGARPTVRKQLRVPPAAVPAGPAGVPPGPGSLQLLLAGCLAPDPALAERFPPAALLTGGFCLRTPNACVLFDADRPTIGALAGLGLDPACIDVLVARTDASTSLAGIHAALGSFDTVAGSSHAAQRGPACLMAPENWFRDGHLDLTEGATPPGKRLPVLSARALHGLTVDGRAVRAAGLMGLDSPAAVHTRITPLDTPARGETASWLIEHGTWCALALGTQWKKCIGRSARPPGWPSRKVQLVVADLGHGNDGLGPAMDALAHLARMLAPELLVVRHVPMDVAFSRSQQPDGAPGFAPSQLRLLAAELQARVAEHAPRTRVILPGRQALQIRHDVERGVGLAPHPDAAFTPEAVASFGRAPHEFRTGDPDLAREVRQAVRKLVDDRRPFLFIDGPSGSGKTLLAHAIAASALDELQQRGESAQRASSARARPAADSAPTAPDREPASPAGKDSDMIDSAWNETLRRKIAALPHIDSLDLARWDTSSNLIDNDIFGRVPATLEARDPGSPGRLSKPRGFLILNQWEKLDQDATRRLTDVFSAWTYQPFGSARSLPVRVRIILTCNVSFNALQNMAPDVRNRLRSHRLEIPDLETMPEAARRREIDLFLESWSNQHSAWLTDAARELSYRVDLRQGALRCLGDLLEHALRVEADMQGWNDPPGRTTTPEGAGVVVREHILRKVMQQDGVALRAERRDHGARVPVVLCLKVAVWLSYDCESKPSYQVLRPGQGRSPAQFRHTLALATACLGSTEGAWLFHTGEHALRLLAEARDLRHWALALCGEQDPQAAQAVLQPGEGDPWHTDRLHALRRRLRPGTAGFDELHRRFVNRLEKAQARQGKNSRST